MQSSDKRVCVLIADDEPNLADSLAMVLEAQGFRAVPVYNGETAVERARDLKPDVLITDMNMPGMTGIELALNVLNELPKCRVVVITGQNALSDITSVQAEEREFPLLQKPFNPRLLLNLLSESRKAATTAEIGMIEAEALDR